MISMESEVLAAFERGAKRVCIGVDGGEGHVYRDVPLKRFERDAKGNILLTGEVIGVDGFEPCRELAEEEDFELPGYGEAWLSATA